MTQSRVAERANVSMQHLGALERGEKSPTLAVLHRIAFALEVDLPTLLAPFKLSQPPTVSRTHQEREIKKLISRLDIWQLEQIRRIILAAFFQQ